jgi:hypothetical protein
MSQGIIEIKLGDTVIKINTDEETLIHEVSSDMDTAASRIAFYGELLGAVAEEKMKVDSAYRSWRAKFTLSLLEKEEKTAEWKMKAAIEATQTFLDFKAAIAKATYNEVSLNNLIVALKEKSPNLRSKGARQRAELDATDMNTKSTQSLKNETTLRELSEQSQPSTKQPKKAK